MYDETDKIIDEESEETTVEETIAGEVITEETSKTNLSENTVANICEENFSEIVQLSEKPKKATLTVSGLNKRFGKKNAVTDVSFSMNQGEVVGLLGPNGAGKTTTFYMIVGFYRPNSGDVFLDSHCITKLEMYKRAQLGISYLPQEASVFRKLTVEQNIYAILETRSDLTKAQRKQRLEELLNEFGIADKRKQPAYSLSGGERRRTEIARSLAIEPKFLLLDEPFAGIDPIAIHDIKQIISHLSKSGIGVLITDHNVRDTLEITDRAYIIDAGQVVESGDREKILNSEIARRIYLGESFRM
ncbi:MAG: LPS export ABC transporter ATP-binding protein [Treponemataceae bacterium]